MHYIVFDFPFIKGNVGLMVYLLMHVKRMSFETLLQRFNPVLGGSGRTPMDLSVGRMTPAEF